MYLAQLQQLRSRHFRQVRFPHAMVSSCLRHQGAGHTYTTSTTSSRCFWDDMFQGSRESCRHALKIKSPCCPGRFLLSLQLLLQFGSLWIKVVGAWSPGYLFTKRYGMVSEKSRSPKNKWEGWRSCHPLKESTSAQGESYRWKLRMKEPLMRPP